MAASRQQVSGACGTVHCFLVQTAPHRCVTACCASPHWPRSLSSLSSPPIGRATWRGGWLVALAGPGRRCAPTPSAASGGGRAGPWERPRLHARAMQVDSRCRLQLACEQSSTIRSACRLVPAPRPALTFLRFPPAPCCLPASQHWLVHEVSVGRCCIQRALHGAQSRLHTALCLGWYCASTLSPSHPGTSCCSITTAVYGSVCKKLGIPMRCAAS